MKAARHAFVSPLLALALACADGSPTASSAVPSTEEQKTLYALGLAMARSLGVFGLSEDELRFVTAGLADGVLGRPAQVALEEVEPKIRELARSRAQAASQLEQEASASLVSAAQAEAGAETTGTGLVIKIDQLGTGAMPTAADVVRVHYHGTLRDGSVFDSSVERGEPATFPLDRVIPCWTEAIQRMAVGTKAHIVCPAAIAYGDQGAPPRIPPGAALRFDVELLEIVKHPPVPGAPGAPATPE
jgi:FKBP-type peptidyl-prolyl cis-trans isomerase